MTDLLFQMGLSNALFALALALVALVAGAGARRPHVAHLLWLLVLVKLVTPPILTLPIGPYSTESKVAPQALQTAAERMVRRLGLNTIPAIRTTSTHLSPMVWWTGGTVRVAIPTALLDQMDAQQSQWILAHELAYVRRPWRAKSTAAGSSKGDSR